MSVTFCAAFVLTTLLAGYATGRAAAFAATAIGVLMLAIATLMLRRAHLAVAQLTERRDALAHELTAGDNPLPAPTSHTADSSAITSTTMPVTIVHLTEERFDDFFGLIEALADYESLARPDAAAKERMRTHALGRQPRFEAALALDDSGRAIAYATWFETYSTFLARPTMFLEDLFVLEAARGSGAGGTLFEHVRALGAERGCGRMDWNVLDWNSLARAFYHRRDAQWMKEWLLYRISY